MEWLDVALHAQATEKDSTGMIDYTEFCEILQVRHSLDRFRGRFFMSDLVGVA